MKTYIIRPDAAIGSDMTIRAESYEDAIQQFADNIGVIYVITQRYTADFQKFTIGTKKTFIIMEQ